MPPRGPKLIYTTSTARPAGPRGPARTPRKKKRPKKVERQYSTNAVERERKPERLYSTAPVSESKEQRRKRRQVTQHPRRFIPGYKVRERHEHTLAVEMREQRRAANLLARTLGRQAERELAGGRRVDKKLIDILPKQGRDSFAREMLRSYEAGAIAGAVRHRPPADYTRASPRLASKVKQAQATRRSLEAELEPGATDVGLLNPVNLAVDVATGGTALVIKAGGRAAAKAAVKSAITKAPKATVGSAAKAARSVRTRTVSTRAAAASLGTAAGRRRALDYGKLAAGVKARRLATAIGASGVGTSGILAAGAGALYELPRQQAKQAVRDPRKYTQRTLAFAPGVLAGLATVGANVGKSAITLDPKYAGEAGEALVMSNLEMAGYLSGDPKVQRELAEKYGAGPFVVAGLPIIGFRQRKRGPAKPGSRRARKEERYETARLIKQIKGMQASMGAAGARHARGGKKKVLINGKTRTVVQRGMKDLPDDYHRAAALMVAEGRIPIYDPVRTEAVAKRIRRDLPKNSQDRAVLDWLVGEVRKGRREGRNFLQESGIHHASAAWRRGQQISRREETHLSQLVQRVRAEKPSAFDQDILLPTERIPQLPGVSRETAVKQATTLQRVAAKARRTAERTRSRRGGIDVAEAIRVDKARGEAAVLRAEKKKGEGVAHQRQKLAVTEAVLEHEKGALERAAQPKYTVRPKTAKVKHFESLETAAAYAQKTGTKKVYERGRQYPYKTRKVHRLDQQQKLPAAPAEAAPKPPGEQKPGDAALAHLKQGGKVLHKGQPLSRMRIKDLQLAARGHKTSGGTGTVKAARILTDIDEQAARVKPSEGQTPKEAAVGRTIKFDNATKPRGPKSYQADVVVDGRKVGTIEKGISQGGMRANEYVAKIDGKIVASGRSQKSVKAELDEHLDAEGQKTPQSGAAEPEMKVGDRVYTRAGDAADIRKIVGPNATVELLVGRAKGHEGVTRVVPLKELSRDEGTVPGAAKREPGEIFGDLNRTDEMMKGARGNAELLDDLRRREQRLLDELRDAGVKVTKDGRFTLEHKTPAGNIVTRQTARSYSHVVLRKQDDGTWAAISYSNSRAGAERLVPKHLKGQPQNVMIEAINFGKREGEPKPLVPALPEKPKEAPAATDIDAAQRVEQQIRDAESYMGELVDEANKLDAAGKTKQVNDVEMDMINQQRYLDELKAERDKIQSTPKWTPENPRYQLKGDRVVVTREGRRKHKNRRYMVWDRQELREVPNTTNVSLSRANQIVESLNKGEPYRLKAGKFEMIDADGTLWKIDKQEAQGGKRGVWRATTADGKTFTAGTLKQAADEIRGRTKAAVPAGGSQVAAATVRITPGLADELLVHLGESTEPLRKGIGEAIRDLDSKKGGTLHLSKEEAQELAEHLDWEFGLTDVMTARDIFRERGGTALRSAARKVADQLRGQGFKPGQKPKVAGPPPPEAPAPGQIKQGTFDIDLESAPKAEAPKAPPTPKQIVETKAKGPKKSALQVRLEARAEKQRARLRELESKPAEVNMPRMSREQRARFTKEEMKRQEQELREAAAKNEEAAAVLLALAKQPADIAGFRAQMRAGRQSSGRAIPGYVAHARERMKDAELVPPRRRGTAVHKVRGVRQRRGQITRRLSDQVIESFMRPMHQSAMVMILNELSRFRMRPDPEFMAAAHDARIKIDSSDGWLPLETWRKLEEAGIVDGKKWSLMPISKTEMERIHAAARRGDAFEDSLIGLSVPSVRQRSKLAHFDADAGERFQAWPAERLAEFTRQSQPARYNRLRRFGAWQAAAVLSTSFAWPLMQVIAEGVPTATETLRWRKWTKEFDRMTDRQKAILGSYTGGVYGWGMGPKQLEALGEFDPKHALEASGMLARTPMGRAVRGAQAVPFVLQHLDAWKGMKFRRIVAMKEATRLADQQLARLMKKQGDVWRYTDQALEKMKKAPAHERAAWMMEHYPAEMRRVDAAVRDVLGDWTTITRREQLPAALAFFYPMLRYTLRFVFHSFPKRHPLLAFVTYTLGQQNTQEVLRLLGGEDPAYASLLMSGILFGGEPRPIDLARASPAGNAAVEVGLTGQLDWSLARLTQPVFGALVGAAAGVNPTTGLFEIPEGARIRPTGRLVQPTEGGKAGTGLQLRQQGKLVAQYLARMPGVFRQAEQLFAYDRRRDFPFLGKPEKFSPGPSRDFYEHVQPTGKQAFAHSMVPFLFNQPFYKQRYLQQYNAATDQIALGKRRDLQTEAKKLAASGELTPTKIREFTNLLNLAQKASIKKQRLEAAVQRRKRGR